MSNHNRNVHPAKSLAVEVSTPTQKKYTEPSNRTLLSSTSISSMDKHHQHSDCEILVMDGANEKLRSYGKRVQNTICKRFRHSVGLSFPVQGTHLVPLINRLQVNGTQFVVILKPEHAIRQSMDLVLIGLSRVQEHCQIPLHMAFTLISIVSNGMRQTCSTSSTEVRDYEVALNRLVEQWGERKSQPSSAVKAKPGAKPLNPVKLIRTTKMLKVDVGESKGNTEPEPQASTPPAVIRPIRRPVVINPTPTPKDKKSIVYQKAKLAGVRRQEIKFVPETYNNPKEILRPNLRIDELEDGELTDEQFECDTGMGSALMNSSGDTGLSSCMEMETESNIKLNNIQVHLTKGTKQVTLRSYVPQNQTLGPNSTDETTAAIIHAALHDQTRNQRFVTDKVIRIPAVNRRRPNWKLASLSSSSSSRLDDAKISAGTATKLNASNTKNHWNLANAKSRVYKRIPVHARLGTITPVAARLGASAGAAVVQQRIPMRKRLG